MGALQQDRELELITGLCRRLARMDLNVGMSDAQPAVVIRIRNEPSLWITVDRSGEYFEWHEAQYQHSVTDSAGAAVVISEYVKAQPSAPGEAS
jgi:hypothetical protein